MSRKIIRMYILILLDFAIYFSLYRGIIYLGEQFAWTYVPTVINLIINILIVYTWVNILVKKDYNAYDNSWLLLMVVAPLWGFLLFLSVANDFRNSRRYKKRKYLEDEQYIQFEPSSDIRNIPDKYQSLFEYTSRNTKHAVFQDNSTAKVLSSGQDFFDDLIHKIENASKFIYVQFYIFKTDNIGKKIVDLLCKKSEEGLEVKVLYDYFGGQEFDTVDFKRMRNSGIDVYPIDRVWVPLLNTKINYRNHRKIVVIDGEYGYTGGFNIGDEYIHGTKKYKWRDTNVKVEGSIVQSFTALFARDYYYVTNDLIEQPDKYNGQSNTGKGYMQLLQSGPDTEPLIRNTYIKMINSARKSIKITSPYLGLDTEMLLALSLAAKSGVDVQIMIPEIPDKKTVYKVTESFIDDLLRNKVRVFKIKETFIHSKVIIVDDEIACCGTYNLDVRSALINFENTVLMYNESVNTLVEDFSLDLQNSTEITLATWEKRSLFQNFFTEIFKIFTPIT